MTFENSLIPLTALSKIRSLLVRPVLLLFIVLFSAVLSSQAISAQSLSIKEPVSLANSAIISFGPEKLMDYLGQEHDKPLIVLMSSSDASCEKCLKANQAFTKLSQKRSSEYQFIQVDTNPWNKKHLRTSLYFHMSENAPTTLIFYKSKVLRKLVGHSYSKMNTYLKDVQKIIEQDQLERFGDKLEEGIYSVVVQDNFIKYTKKYPKADGYKAFAVFTGKRRYWSGNWIYGRLSQEKANQGALKKCEIQAQKKGRAGKCKLYWVDDQYVYNKTPEQVSKITQSIIGVETPLDKEVKKLRARKSHTALAYAEGEFGGVSYHTAYNFDTEQEAKSFAMEKCAVNAKKNKIDAACTLYFLDGEIIEAGLTTD